MFPQPFPTAFPLCPQLATAGSTFARSADAAIPAIPMRLRRDLRIPGDQSSESLITPASHVLPYRNNVSLGGLFRKRALMRSADRVPINFARSKHRRVCGMSQSSVTTEFISYSLPSRSMIRVLPPGRPIVSTDPACHGWLAVVLLPQHQRPRDPGHLVGHCQRDQSKGSAPE
jgi:hypothetical protein